MVDHTDRGATAKDNTRADASTTGPSACVEAIDYGVQASANGINAPDGWVETAESGIKAASNRIEAATMGALWPLVFYFELSWFM